MKCEREIRLHGRAPIGERCIDDSSERKNDNFIVINSLKLVSIMWLRFLIKIKPL